jgi:predicted phage terminase large subunit-like protein
MSDLPMQRELEKLTPYLQRDEYEPYKLYFDALRVLGDADRQEANRHNRELRIKATRQCKVTADLKKISDFYDLIHKTYIYGAACSFDDFMVATEWNRDPKARFWIPRRNVLEGRHKIASMIQAFLDSDDALFLGFSMPPGCGKTTLIKFLLAYIYGLYPDSANMYVSYADAMVKMVYDGVTSIITDKTEYSFSDVFPTAKTPLCSAEYYTITARKKGDFPTLGLISLGGPVTGRTRANKLLVTDDLVKNKEVARSPERLETLYSDYLATLTTRTIGDNVKQIMLGTIWSIHDPLSRMKTEHEDNPRYAFITLPVCDEDGKSLFCYDHPDRYTDERIADLKSTLDPVDFSCLYMQKGIEKEGLAFPADSLQYYNGILPDGDPDNILFYSDVAFGGGDSFSMPIAYMFGADVFVHDVIFDRGDKSITMPRVVGKILQHKIKMGQFEANSGGDFYCDEVDRILREKHNYSANIGSKKASSKMSKLSRIEQHAPAIRRFYFRDTRCRDLDYKRFMDELTTFSFTSKNLHDDAPDSLAGLADKLYHGMSARVELGARPW